VDDPDVKLLVLIVLAAVLAGVFWYYREDILPLAEEPVVMPPVPVVEEAPAPKTPMHPLAPSKPLEPTERELVPLPPLDDSDSYFLLALIDAFGLDVKQVLVKEALVDKFVATVDNLTRSHVAEKIRPVVRLSGLIVVDAKDNDGQFELSPKNYKRYDSLVSLIANADLEVIAAMYRRFYPLFQESYVQLGYPYGYFNDRVVQVIDHLLTTPEPNEPIRLVRPHVLYEYADAELEALSSGQKLLLRMGKQHAETIKQVLRGLRALIAQSPESAP
jgi:hypothetical protein